MLAHAHVVLGDRVEGGRELVEHKKLGGLQEDAGHDDLLPVRENLKTGI
jgi:hypothetical protein